MKKILLLLILLISSTLANNIKWYASYDKALEQAHKTKKNLMIYIASSKEVKSKKILKEYFTNKDYIEYLNKNFINVLVTIEYKTSYPIELFYTTTFPTIFFASYKDESFLTHPIYEIKSQEDFSKILYSIDLN